MGPRAAFSPYRGTLGQGFGGPGTLGRGGRGSSSSALRTTTSRGSLRGRSSVVFSGFHQVQSGSNGSSEVAADLHRGRGGGIYRGHTRYT